MPNTMAERLVPRHNEEEGAKAPTSAEYDTRNKYGRWLVDAPSGTVGPHGQQQGYIAGTYDDVRRVVECDWPTLTRIVWAPDVGGTMSPEELHAPLARTDFNPKPWTEATYYKAGSTDIRDVIEMFGLNFNRGSVAKYVFRAGRKPGNAAILDLYKAREHILREIARLEAQEFSTHGHPANSARSDISPNATKPR